MLFSAQQQQRDEQSISEMASPAEAVVQQSQATSNQQSLHRFWNIASQPTVVQEAAMSEPEQAACLPSFPAEEGGYIQSTLDQTPFVRHTMI